MMKKSEIDQPISIGGRSVKNRLWAAPMSGLTHLAFRKVLSSFGGFGLCYTEMCSAKALLNERPGQSRYFDFEQEELGYLVCQIQGSDPETLGAAAELVEDLGFFAVELNASCSVAAVCKQGAGARLLRLPQLAQKCLAAMRKKVEIPVLVKFRTGWQKKEQNPVQMARLFEQAGADALIFHPRLAPDRRTRPPDWEQITEVADSVEIPVLGNGNVFDEQDIDKMLSRTNCSGISLGRLTIARPWFFCQVIQGKEFGPKIYFQTALGLLNCLEERYPEKTGLYLFKKFLLYFAANFKYGNKLRGKVLKAKNYAELRENLQNYLFPCPEVLARPNVLLFTH